jgi:hypothetical protein
MRYVFYDTETGAIVREMRGPNPPVDNQILGATEDLLEIDPDADTSDKKVDLDTLELVIT